MWTIMLLIKGNIEPFHFENVVNWGTVYGGKSFALSQNTSGGLRTLQYGFDKIQTLTIVKV